ncbi:FxDxF family PEP-CTERM protein [Roseateles violae]|uniref:FxDxF family PEP-CTERM protein n=1 Tax=Roseateles violae TaxID=3058042 RepID=A0ABT8E0F0_9BURK|nr:FxDxF family PEP-CTERM protein [Pelomonas sp. PFR6]MDN3923285.1 FxDxF family PEP-CTERM protein [Pelomonas sp. PFR6]
MHQTQQGGKAMKLSKVIAASSLALASAGSFAVSLGAIDLSSGSGFFGNTPIAGAFVDTLTFTVTTLATFNGSITSAVNGTQDVDFTSIVLTPGSLAFTSVLGDPVEVWAAPAVGFSLSPGVYTLTLTGTNSASMGSYAGNLALTPGSPTLVPEPESYAMMLAGLGLVTLLARRRRG